MRRRRRGRVAAGPGPVEDTLAEARRLGGRPARTATGWTRIFLGCLSAGPVPAALRAARAVDDRANPRTKPDERLVQVELALCVVTAAGRTGRWLSSAQTMYAGVVSIAPDHCRLPGVRRHLEAALGRPVEA